MNESLLARVRSLERAVSSSSPSPVQIDLPRPRSPRPARPLSPGAASNASSRVEHLAQPNERRPFAEGLSYGHAAATAALAADALAPHSYAAAAATALAPQPEPQPDEVRHPHHHLNDHLEHRHNERYAWRQQKIQSLSASLSKPPTMSWPPLPGSKLHWPDDRFAAEHEDVFSSLHRRGQASRLRIKAKRYLKAQQDEEAELERLRSPKRPTQVWQRLHSDAVDRHCVRDAMLRYVYDGEPQAVEDVVAMQGSAMPAEIGIAGSKRRELLSQVAAQIGRERQPSPPVVRHVSAPRTSSPGPSQPMASATIVQPGVTSIASLAAERFR